MNLRVRFALALGTLAAAATIAAGVSSYISTRNRLNQEVDAALQETANAAVGDPRFEPAPLLREHVTAGRLGRKSGSGFFSYS